MRLSLILSCPIKNGSGHLSRINSIANVYKKKNFYISIYIVSKKIKKKFIIPEFYKNIVIVESYQKLKVSYLHCEILIIDDYHIPLKTIDFLKSKSKFNFYIQDHKIIRSLKPIKKQLIFKNNKYYFINFFMSPLIIKKKPLIKNKILITFGTGRVESKLMIIFKYLKKIDQKINKILFIDITNQLNDKHLKIINSFNNIKIQKINDNQYFKNINNYSFSINAAGVTCIELLYLQIPQIVFLFSDNQKKNFNYLKKINNKNVMSVGKLNTKNFHIFYKFFILMLSRIGIYNYKNIRDNDILFGEKLPLIHY